MQWCGVAVRVAIGCCRGSGGDGGGVGVRVGIGVRVAVGMLLHLCPSSPCDHIE